jgi:twitching motility protein PilT
VPHVDRLLTALVASRGDAVELLEGEPAAFRSAGVRRPVTRQPLSSAQLLAFVREIAPSELAGHFETAGGAEFRYASPDGAFDVRIERSEGRWSAVLVPARDRAPLDSALAIAAPVAIAGYEPTALGAGDLVPVDATRASAAGPAPPTATAPVVASPATVTPAASHALPIAARPAAERSGAGADRARVAMDRLLRLLVERGGSDLHLRVGEPPVVRASGELVRLEEPALDAAAIEAMLLAIMPERNRVEFDERNDTDYAYEIAGVARYRANALRDRVGPAGVFRVIPAKVVTVEEMGLSAEVQQLCQLTKGLVLVTGPTGSGKSTTLCALVDLVNRSRPDHILTIEDPIEFVHPSKQCLITQRQVGVHTASFKSALRAALREDPDVILVGELRDLETISIAIETAETGHLVFGTLHTTTAPSTVDRIIDQFPADRQSQIRVMLSESLKGVISQTLCRKIGGGRAAAREVLLGTPAVSNLIREGKTFQIPRSCRPRRRSDGHAQRRVARAGRRQRGAARGVTKRSKSGFVQGLRNRGIDTRSPTPRSDARGCPARFAGRRCEASRDVPSDARRARRRDFSPGACPLEAQAVHPARQIPMAIGLAMSPPAVHVGSAAPRAAVTSSRAMRRWGRVTLVVPSSARRRSPLSDRSLAAPSSPRRRSYSGRSL